MTTTTYTLIIASEAQRAAVSAALTRALWLLADDLAPPGPPLGAAQPQLRIDLTGDLDFHIASGTYDAADQPPAPAAPSPTKP